jgi:3',5'-cyclic AMP phosphodiesterase CpdA
MLYRSFFQLPANGPRGLDRGHAYHFEYGDALMVNLDSNLDPATQTQWLDETLGRSKARWKLVSFHHPLYPSHPKRSNDHLLQAWGQVIDKHQVDMVLQGHDHAYLRTHPMRGGQRVTPSDGTYYVVSVSGTKFYEQADRPYTAVGLVQTPTYQVISVTPDVLHLKAYDLSGTVRDELIKRKD